MARLYQGSGSGNARGVPPYHSSIGRDFGITAHLESDVCSRNEVCRTHIRLAVRNGEEAAKFIEEKFTYTVTGWNPDVDLFMDGPTRIISVGASKTHLPKRAIASLVLKEARGTKSDGTSVQIFNNDSHA